MHSEQDDTPAPLLLTAKQAAQMCGMSLRTWRRKDAAGQVPAAVLVGGGPTKRLRVDELSQWCKAGFGKVGFARLR